MSAGWILGILSGVIILCNWRKLYRPERNSSRAHPYPASPDRRMRGGYAGGRGGGISAAAVAYPVQGHPTQFPQAAPTVGVPTAYGVAAQPFAYPGGAQQELPIAYPTASYAGGGGSSSSAAACKSRANYAGAPHVV